MEDLGGEKTDLVSLTGIIYAHRMLALGRSRSWYFCDLKEQPL